MKNILICCLCIFNTIIAQNKNQANELIEAIYIELINNDGSIIDFEYLFENEAHKMEKPINGKLG